MTAAIDKSAPVSRALTNPVLPGFFPDPSVVRVGEWYYIANSSFEWFPTIPIHRSRDLIHWEFAGSLRGPDVQFDFGGIQDSGSIWAPSLSWYNGVFWLTFTVVRSFGSQHKDMDAYISKATDVSGPWSKPARVTTTGFDPSLFHHDGRHWLANMEWDHRPGPRHGFAGITLQELNTDGTATLGVPENILLAEALTEGPNLYYRDGWYYLMVAEGGTGWNHGIGVYRSRELHGPYVADPDGAMLTSRDDPSQPLQKAGHGELVDATDGRTFLVHLASRCIQRHDEKLALLGRETCMQEIIWNTAGWPRLIQGGHHPAASVAGSAPSGDAKVMANTGFPAAGEPLGWPWNTLRTSKTDGWLDTRTRPGWLRLTGRRSTDSLIEQSLIAQRITAASIAARVTVEARPANYTQSAGLILYYNTSAYFYLRTSSPGIETSKSPHRVVELWERDALNGLVVHATKTVDDGQLHFGVSFSGGWVQFHSAGSAEEPLQWTDFGPRLDAAHLSDDYGGQLRFTGPFVGVCVQDLRDQTFTADFRDFSLTQSAL